MIRMPYSRFIVSRVCLVRFAAALLAVFLSTDACFPQGSAPRGMSGQGSLIIHLISVDGSTMPVAIVTLYTDMGDSTGNNVSRLQEGDDYYYQFSGVLPGRYVIQVSAPGFQESKQTVDLSNAILNEALTFYMKPIGYKGGAPDVPPSSVFTPKAQKETQSALKDLQSKNFDSAQKHLTVALKASPGNSQINFLLGMTYIWMNHPADGKPYLEKAISLDPKHVESLVALGTLKYRDGDYPGAIDLLAKAVQVSSTSWQARLTLAQAYLRQNNFADANEQAGKAFEIGREKAAGAQLVQAQALAGLGKNHESANVLSSYLTANPSDPNAEKLRGWITELERPVEDVATVQQVPVAAPVAAPDATPIDSLPAPPSKKDTWAPPDSDAIVPTVVPGRPCSLPKVLAGAGKRAQELVANLEQFTALEQYETVEIKSNGQLSTPTDSAFTYMAFIHSLGHGMFSVREVHQQNKTDAVVPGRIQEIGSPGLALLFHPQYQGDFDMKCEGLGQWNGEPTWLVHFQQRLDKPARMQGFVLDQKQFPMKLRGRAWISADNSQVVHLETDLLEPVTEVQLRREHMSIDYRLVPFPNHKVDLWLPEQVDSYLDYKGHFYHHYHKFSDFRLISVDVQHKVSKPK